MGFRHSVSEEPMTQHKHLKQIIRTRMEKTGERYAAARRNVMMSSAAAVPPPPASAGPATYFTGSVAATTALRTLVTAAGLLDPRTGRAFTEAMLFGIAGGIGAGVFSFVYEKDNFASLFFGARHYWQDDEAYLRKAIERIGLRAEIRESSSPAAAEKALRAILQSNRPAIAFVEAGLLPHRATKPEYLGGGYHVVTVHGVDDTRGVFLVGDLAGRPIPVPVADFAAARARIKKFKNRLIAVSDEAAATPSLPGIVREGLAACHRGLGGEGAVANARRNFTLDALGDLADRMTSNGRDSWAKQIPPGARLWNVLTMAHHFVAHSVSDDGGMGGGLCRPLFAEFLGEAAEILRDGRLSEAAAGYRALGARWTEFANAALPAGVPLFDKARKLMTKRAELRRGNIDAKAISALAKAEATLQELAVEAGDCFPLSEEQAALLRTDLAARIRELYREEVRLHDLLGRTIAEPIAA